MGCVPVKPGPLAGQIVEAMKSKKNLTVAMVKAASRSVQVVDASKGGQCPCSWSTVAELGSSATKRQGTFSA